MWSDARLQPSLRDLKLPLVCLPSSTLLGYYQTSLWDEEPCDNVVYNNEWIRLRLHAHPMRAHRESMPPNAGNNLRRKLLLPKKPFLGMKGAGKNATDHGGTVYGFGKEAEEATAEGSKARRLREAVSHAGGLEASPKRHGATVASLALANSTPRYGLGIDDVCLWRLPGRAIRVCSGGGDSIAA